MLAPKIGFEIESVAFNLQGAIHTADFLLPQDDKTKGQILHFFTANGEPDLALNSTAKSNWIPTAEVQTNIQKIQLEMIYGGPTGVAISVAELGAVGEQMCVFLHALDAQARDASKPPVTKPKDGGGKAFMRPANLLSLSQTHTSVRWEITGGPSSAGLGFHATAPIPLAALPGLVHSEPNEILFGNAPQRANMAVVTSVQVKTSNFSLASIQWRAAGPVGKLYGENSVVGLLIMIMSYVNKSDASPSERDMDLKTKTPLMPRTDFTTMLNIVTGLMVEASATAFRQNLVAIVQSIKGSSLQNCFFNWARPALKAPTETAVPSQAQSAAAPPPPPPAPAPPPPPGPTSGAPRQRIPISNTQPVIQPWNLNVQTWLEDIVGGKADQLALKDAEFREKQIGALGNKVETAIGDPSLLCPILEFRGIGSCSFAQLQAKPQNFLQQLAARVQYWHQQALSGK